MSEEVYGVSYRTVNVRAHWRNPPKKKTRNRVKKRGSKQEQDNLLNQM